MPIELRDLEGEGEEEGISLDDDLSTDFNFEKAVSHHLKATGYSAKNWEIIIGDCVEKMRGMKENSIDCIATDPPYGIEFMGKDWDKNFDKRAGTIEPTVGKQEGIRLYVGTGLSKYAAGEKYQIWSYAWAREALRVLKPGALMFVMGHPRTFHRMACGVEDAGFNIIDVIQWVYWTGFPKAYDIGKGFDKAAGKKGKKVGRGKAGLANPTMLHSSNLKGGYGFKETEFDLTTPSSELGKKWEGWKSAKGLKPAHEPILFAQKPLSEKTICKNVAKHGVGGINADGARIPITDLKGEPNYREKFNEYKYENSSSLFGTDEKIEGYWKDKPKVQGKFNVEGRFPANLIASPNVNATRIPTEDKIKSSISGGSVGLGEKIKGHIFNPSDIGRFPANLLSLPKILGKNTRMVDIDAWANEKFDLNFWKFIDVPKPSKKEKNEGLESTQGQWTKHGHIPVGENLKKAPKKGNFHPTVKPMKLFLYLLSLGCPAGGTVLDPFLGSGTTIVAALKLGLHGIGIEREENYVQIAKGRIEHANGV
jgi:site-specific DNA-methyltransferase (adenine-specific)